VDPLTSNSSNGKEVTNNNELPSENDNCPRDIASEILRKYVKQSYLSTLSDYAIRPLKARCQLWKDMHDKGIVIFPTICLLGLSVKMSY